MRRRKRLDTVLGCVAHGLCCFVEVYSGFLFEERSRIPIRMAETAAGRAFDAFSALKTVDFVERRFVGQMISARHLSCNAVPIDGKRRYLKIDAVIQVRKEDAYGALRDPEASQG